MSSSLAAPLLPPDAKTQPLHVPPGYAPAPAPASARDDERKSVLSKASLGTYNKRELRDELSRRVHLVSVLVNISLFGSKLWVYIASRAMVVLAALVDSTVDLLAQAILLWTNRVATTARTEHKATP